MFTGIVQGVGRITHVATAGDGVHIVVDFGVREIADVALGDSICVNGCCSFTSGAGVPRCSPSV